jgi:large subunit ribosomal protein L13
VGRLAPQIARLLMGKHKPTYMPNIDAGDTVVVVNARHVAFTGDKATSKLYKWHTGWMGGLKTLTARHLLEREPGRILEHAVKGMLPPNKLRHDRLKRLRVYPDAEHDEAARVGVSQAYAPEYLKAFAPRRVEPRPEGESGLLVTDAAAELGVEGAKALEKAFKPLGAPPQLAAAVEARRRAGAAAADGGPAPPAATAAAGGAGARPGTAGKR